MELVVAGFSESRLVVQALLPILGCAHMRLKDTLCASDSRWEKERNMSFLDNCRDRLPVEHETCTGRLNISLTWVWESTANIDQRLVSLFEQRKPSDPRLVLLYSVGPHYFTQFPGHRPSQWYHDNGVWPQEWLTQYYKDVRALMYWLRHLRTSRGACVLWKTNNIGPKTRTGASATHPSTEGRFHHWLNRWTIAMAEEASVPVVDVQPLTLTDQPHGDPYHSTNATRIAELVLRGIESVCI